MLSFFQCIFWLFSKRTVFEDLHETLNRVAFKILQVVFFLDGHDYKSHVESVAIQQSIPYITKKPVFICSDQFENWRYKSWYERIFGSQEM